MKGRRSLCLHFSCCFLPPLSPVSPLDKSYAPLLAAFTFPRRCCAQGRQQAGLVQPFLARACCEPCTFPHNESNVGQRSSSEFLRQRLGVHIRLLWQSRQQLVQKRLHLDLACKVHLDDMIEASPALDG